MLEPAAWGQQQLLHQQQLQPHHHKQQQQLSAAVRSCQLLSAATGDAGAQQQVEVLRQQHLLQPQTLPPGWREVTWQQQQQQQMLQQQQILQQQTLQQPQMLPQHHHPQHGSQPQVPRLAGGICPDAACGTRGAVLAFSITPILVFMENPYRDRRDRAE